jgi:hypothetical protein
VAHAQRGPTTRLVRELAIGDEALPKGFTSIGSVLVGPGGRIYVEQSQDNVIRLFDSTGKYVKDIGGKGSGPGETEFLYGIGFVGDTLWSCDLRAGRFAFFSADGGYQSTLSPPKIIDSAVKRNAISASASTPLSGGYLYYGAVSYASRMGPELMRPVARVVGTRDGRVVDTVAFTDSLGRGSFGYANGSRQTFTSDGAFGSMVDKSPYIAVGGEGAWFAVVLRADCATRPRYTVARVSLRGDTLWRARLECPHVTIPRNFVDSVVAVNRERAIKIVQVTASYAEEQIRPKLGDVKAFTPVRSVQVGNDGSIWIRPLLSVADTVEVWMRADAKSGAPEQFTLPYKSQLKRIVDGTHIWVSQLDENDLPTLVRYRVVSNATER